METEECTGTTVLTMPRHYSSAQVKSIAAEIARMFQDEKTGTIVLDFNDTLLVDSNGIGTLVSIAREAQERRVGLRFRHLNPNLMELFNQTGLNRIFTIEKNEQIIAATVDLFEPSFDVKLRITHEPAGEIEVFHLSGIMSHPEGSSYFKQQLLLSLSRSRKVLLAVEELTFIDSMSISALLRMNNLLSMTGGSMGICGAAFIVRDLLDTLNIGMIIPLYNSREEAFSSWMSNDD